MKRILALLPLPVALLVRWVASLRPQWVERWFSTGLYPAVAAPVSRLMSLCPVPVIELLLVIFFFFMLYWLWKKRFFRMVIMCGLILSVFVGGWGLNYFRLPLEETLNLSVRPSTPEELRGLCERLINDANARRVDPPENPIAQTNAAMNAAAEKWPIPTGTFGSAKVALASPLLTRLLIEGITSPFTLEALVNGQIPAVSQPFVACHEAAHVRGFAREEDANLIAYLACEASGDVFTGYSGTIGALLHALGALRDTDHTAYLLLWEGMTPGVKADIAFHTTFWNAYRQTKAAQVSAAVNDAYLQTAGGSGQSSRSYGRMVDLLLALERQGAI